MITITLTCVINTDEKHNCFQYILWYTLHEILVYLLKMLSVYSPTKQDLNVVTLFLTDQDIKYPN